MIWENEYTKVVYATGCGYCGSQQGEKCTKDGITPVDYLHIGRRVVAGSEPQTEEDINLERRLWSEAWSLTITYINETDSISAHDLFQEMYLFILEKGWRDHPEEILWGYVRKHAKQRIAISFRNRIILNPDENYSTKEIRYITAFSPMALYDTTHYLGRAFRELPDQYRKALIEKYILKHPQETEAEKKVVRRAEERLTDYINKPWSFKGMHDGPGSRRAISNAHARYILDTQWDDNSVIWLVGTYGR